MRRPGHPTPPPEGLGYVLAALVNAAWLLAMGVGPFLPVALPLLLALEIPLVHLLWRLEYGAPTGDQVQG
ncbi:MAG: hypothetical protein R3F30_15705 [Planctomycetota bacterium]